MDDLNKKSGLGDLLIYQNEKGETKIDAYFLDDTEKFSIFVSSYNSHS